MKLKPFFGLRKKLNREENLPRSILPNVSKITKPIVKKEMSLHYSLVEQYRHSVWKKHLLESINANNTYMPIKFKNGKGGWVGGLISEIACSLIDWYEAVIYCHYTVCCLVISLWLTVKVLYIILLLSSFKFNKFS